MTTHHIGGIRSLTTMSDENPPELKEESVIKVEPDDDEEDSDDDDQPTLIKQFAAFVKHKNQKDPGTHILLSQSDAWMKQAGVIKGRILTTTDTGICFFKFKKYKLSYDEYMEFLQILADFKKMNVQDIIDKLVSCGPPEQKGNVTVSQN